LDNPAILEFPFYVTQASQIGTTCFQR